MSSFAVNLAQELGVPHSGPWTPGVMNLAEAVAGLSRLNGCSEEKAKQILSVLEPYTQDPRCNSMFFGAIATNSGAVDKGENTSLENACFVDLQNPANNTWSFADISDDLSAVYCNGFLVGLIGIAPAGVDLKTYSQSVIPNIPNWLYGFMGFVNLIADGADGHVHMTMGLVDTSGADLEWYEFDTAQTAYLVAKSFLVSGAAFNSLYLRAAMYGQVPINNVIYDSNDKIAEVLIQLIDQDAAGVVDVTPAVEEADGELDTEGYDNTEEYGDEETPEGDNTGEFGAGELDFEAFEEGGEEPTEEFNPDEFNPDEFNPDDFNPDEFNPDEFNPDEFDLDGEGEEPMDEFNPEEEPADEFNPDEFNPDEEGEEPMDEFNPEEDPVEEFNPDEEPVEEFNPDEEPEEDLQSETEEDFIGEEEGENFAVEAEAGDGAEQEYKPKAVSLGRADLTNVLRRVLGASDKLVELIIGEESDMEITCDTPVSIDAVCHVLTAEFYTPEIIQSFLLLADQYATEDGTVLCGEAVEALAYAIWGDIPEYSRERALEHAANILIRHRDALWLGVYHTDAVVERLTVLGYSEAVCLRVAKLMEEVKIDEDAMRRKLIKD